MGRPSSPDDAAMGVRAILIEHLAGHERVLVDPRLFMVPEEEWPDPLPVFRDYIADKVDDLRAGRTVACFPAWMIPRELGLVPHGCYSVDIAADGTITPTVFVGVGGAREAVPPRDD